MSRLSTAVEGRCRGGGDSIARPSGATFSSRPVPLLGQLALSLLLAGPAAARGARAEIRWRGEPWPRHTVDRSSRGADGVRLLDIDGSGRPDIATGWEEGGRVRVCLDPGPRSATSIWPSVTVGRVGSPEDAVLVDLDGDERCDVVSASEGTTRTIWVHWGPEPSRRLDPAAWRTEAVPATEGVAQWMFCLPLQVDGRAGIDLIVGAKGAGARVGWLESPPEPRRLDRWRWHPIVEAGWIMSLEAADLDGDGDLDVVLSDRKGARRGCWWLERPARERLGEPWPAHRIGGSGEEVMFLSLSDLDRDGRTDLVAATRSRHLIWLRRRSKSPEEWDEQRIEMPPGTGTAKAVAVGDLDLDGRLEVVITCENARDRRGVLALAGDWGPPIGRLEARDISGPVGTKYDLVELLDLDGDGDLDVLTCEERENLGVIWYENPARSRGGAGGAGGRSGGEAPAPRPVEAPGRQ